MVSRFAGEVAARLDRLPLTAGLWRLVVLISLGGAFEFYDLLMTAYVAPGLVASGLFTAHPAGFFAPSGIGFFVSTTFAGMWLGSVGFGFVADRMGRRTIFTLSLVWYSLATAAMAFQHSAVGIDLWRFIAAIGVGLEQVTIDTLLPELVPPPKRGRVFAVNQGIEFAAVPLVALLGWLLVPLHPYGFEGWRWVALIGASGALAAWWFRLAVPESPRWLALHCHDEAAEKILRRLESRAEQDLGQSLPPPVATVEPPGDRGRFSELFRPPYLKRTVVMSVFNAMQTIAFYGFGSWVPSLLIAKGIAVTTGLKYAFIIALANPIGPLLAFAIADRIERKWQIVAAGVITGICILLFARQENEALVILFGVLVTLANNWLSFTFHGYQAEQFPTRVRARAVGFVYSWSRVSAALAGLLIGFFLHQGGAMAVALFIGAAMTIMVLVIGLWGPKTLNRRLEEISQDEDGMKLMRWGAKGAEKPGLVDGMGVARDLSGKIGDITSDLLSPEGLSRLAGIDPAGLPVIAKDSRLGVPFTGISKIVCIGLNYSDHAAETGAPIPKEPILFLKALNSLSGPYDDIVIPRGSVKTDWEVELGVVIGSRASYLNEQEALDHVAGYCVVNDVSEREYQIERGGQWDKGKGCDSFAPIGPWLVTKDEITEPQNLKLWTEVNGVRRQNGCDQNHDLRCAHGGELYQPFHDLDAGGRHRHRHPARASRWA